MTSLLAQCTNEVRSVFFFDDLGSIGDRQIHGGIGVQLHAFYFFQSGLSDEVSAGIVQRDASGDVGCVKVAEITAGCSALGPQIKTDGEIRGQGGGAHEKHSLEQTSTKGLNQDIVLLRF